jgi:hypothetical protein
MYVYVYMYVYIYVSICLGIQNSEEYCIAYTTQEFIQKIVFLGNNKTIQSILRKDILKFNHRLYENITIIHEWEKMLRYVSEVPRPVPDPKEFKYVQDNINKIMVREHTYIFT